MGIRDILVHVDESDGIEDLIDVAATFASEQEAHLTGVFTVNAEPFPNYGGNVFPAEIIRIYHDNQLKAAKAARDLFESRASKQNINFGWRSVTDDAGNAFAEHLRYSDLAIMRQADENDTHGKELANTVLLSGGRPVMMVPRFGWDKSIGKHVAVAWKPTREATRAVADALPILQRADTVDVLTIGAGQRDDDIHESIGLCEHLARHGVKAEARELNGSNIDAGNQILNFTFDQGCDLLVMGVWGHSRLRESVFGGASRNILDAMTLPVMMSH